MVAPLKSRRMLGLHDLQPSIPPARLHQTRRRRPYLQSTNSLHNTSACGMSPSNARSESKGPMPRTSSICLITRDVQQDPPEHASAVRDPMQPVRRHHQRSRYCSGSTTMSSGSASPTLMFFSGHKASTRSPNSRSTSTRSTFRPFRSKGPNQCCLWKRCSAHTCGTFHTTASSTTR